MIQTLARNVRSRREEMGIAMHGLAEKSGVPVERINLMEMGRLAAPSIQDIAAISRALYCPIETLVNDVERPLQCGGSNAAIVVTPDWPVRLIRASRTELAIAKASGDPFDIELWSRALAVVSHAATRRVERQKGAAA